MNIFSTTANMHKKYQGFSPIILRAWLIVLLQFCFLASQAQRNVEPDSTDIKKQATAADSAAAAAQNKWSHFENKFFTTDLGFAVLLDHNIVEQNDENVEQVGEIEPATELRAGRMVVTGSLLFFKRPWTYFIIVNYNGLDEKSDHFTFLDYTLDIPLGEKGGFL